jgi:hypothetical protein
MIRRSSFCFTNKVLFLIVCSLLLLFVVATDRDAAQAQNPLSESNLKNNSGSAGDAVGRDSRKKVNADAMVTSQPLDEAYGAKIKEYTTEKYFLTELVDHLPASSKIPSPDKTLGYVIGTPNKLTKTTEMYRYYRELAAATPRVRIFMAPERTRKILPSSIATKK